MEIEYQNQRYYLVFPTRVSKCDPYHDTYRKLRTKQPLTDAEKDKLIHFPFLKPMIQGVSYEK